MYNIPGRVVVNMTWETMARLSQLKNIAGVKEANGDMGHVAQTINNTRKGFLIWSGNDNDTFPIMALGGYGVIGVTTHLMGKQYKKMIESPNIKIPEESSFRLFFAHFITLDPAANELFAGIPGN